MSAEGIDVSLWNGAVDWSRVRGDGIEFAFIKSSEGGTRAYPDGIEDPRFAENWAGAGEVGILRGAYHYLRPEHDIAAQAERVLELLDVHGPGELPPALDVEEYGAGPAATADAVMRWLEIVEAGDGRRPVIYTSGGTWRGMTGDLDASRSPLWVAHWGVSAPTIPTPWRAWTIWQWSAAGRVDGIGGDVDRNRFNGASWELRAWASTPTLGSLLGAAAGAAGLVLALGMKAGAAVP